MSRLPRALHLRRHFQRVVLSRPWLTFLVMGLAFFCFGIGTLNLLHLLRANVDFLLENGWMGVLDGGARQLFELVVNGYFAMLAYIVLKSCEHSLTDWLCGKHAPTTQAQDAPAREAAADASGSTDLLH